MARRRFKWLLIFLLGGVGVLGAVYGSVALTTGVPAPEHAFFRGAARRPLVIAHRGGAGLLPENTLAAFEHALALGADVIETDVRLTADGAPPSRAARAPRTARRRARPSPASARC